MHADTLPRTSQPIDARQTCGTRPRPVPNLSLMATRASGGGWTVCELRLIGRVRGPHAVHEQHSHLQTHDLQVG